MCLLNNLDVSFGSLKLNICLQAKLNECPNSRCKIYFLSILSFLFRGSKMVFIFMLTLLRWLAVLNMYTDYFLSSRVFLYYLDLITQGLMTTLPSIFEQLSLVSISLPSKKTFNVLPLTFSGQLVSPLYYVPQLHGMQSSQFLDLFSSKEV